MYRNILLAIDGSEAGMEAASHTQELAAELHADVHGLAVVPQAPLTRDRIRANATEEMDRALSHIEEAFRDAGIAYSRERREGDPCEEILAYAAERSVDLIVMGVSANSRLNALFYGSTTQCVEQQATVPVLVVGTKQTTDETKPMETTVKFHCGSCESSLNVTEEIGDALIENGCILCGSEVTDDMIRAKGGA